MKRAAKTTIQSMRRIFRGRLPQGLLHARAAAAAEARAKVEAAELAVPQAPQNERDEQSALDMQQAPDAPEAAAAPAAAGAGPAVPFAAWPADLPAALPEPAAPLPACIEDLPIPAEPQQPESRPEEAPRAGAEPALPKRRKSIAILVDADNAQLATLPLVVAAIQARGRISLLRAYGNWKKPALARWTPVVGGLTLSALQQFDNVAGKNATDIALVIDAMQMLAAGRYDVYVLVSSDSDFTALALKIREHEKEVVCVGNDCTPEAFRDACDSFISVKSLQAEAAGKAMTKAAGFPDASIAASDASKRVPLDIHRWLFDAWNVTKDAAGWSTASAAGSFLSIMGARLKPKRYGFKGLEKLLEGCGDRYETDVRPSGRPGVPHTFRFRCRTRFD